MLHAIAYRLSILINVVFVAFFAATIGFLGGGVFALSKMDKKKTDVPTE